MNEISEYEYKRNKVRITYIPERGGFFVSINNRLLPGKSAPKWKLFKRLIAGSFKKANKLTIDRDSFFSQQYLSRAVPDAQALRFDQETASRCKWANGWSWEPLL
jgi:hypothetical protein